MKSFLSPRISEISAKVLTDLIYPAAVASQAHTQYFANGVVSDTRKYIYIMYRSLRVFGLRVAGLTYGTYGDGDGENFWG